MFRIVLLAIFLCAVSAFNLPASSSRRDLLARVAAAAPLAAAVAANADSDNRHLTVVTRPPLISGQAKVEENYVAKAIGRQSLVDENGAMVPPNIQFGDTKAVAASPGGADFVPLPESTKNSAMARLMK